MKRKAELCDSSETICHTDNFRVQVVRGGKASQAIGFPENGGVSVPFVNGTGSGEADSNLYLTLKLAAFLSTHGFRSDARQIARKVL